jgi:hypothetical protein
MQPRSDAESHKLLDVGLKLAALNGLEAASSLTLRTRSSLLVNNLTTQLPAAGKVELAVGHNQ